MQGKARLEEYLRDNGVPFQVQHHARVLTAQEVAASERIPGKQLAKVVMAVADGKPVMLALPASYRVDQTRAAEALGVTEVRLAAEQEFAATFPDCEIGAMPPFRLPVRRRCLYGPDVGGRRDDCYAGWDAHGHAEPSVRGLRAAGAPKCGQVRATRMNLAAGAPRGLIGSSEKRSAARRCSTRN